MIVDVFHFASMRESNILHPRKPIFLKHKFQEKEKKNGKKTRWKTYKNGN